MDPQALPWLVPLCPLIGFLINAFAGARLTKSPRPVVETGPLATAVTAAPSQNTGPSDGSQYDMNPAVIASGHDAAPHGATGGHGGHSGHGADVPLDKGGLGIVGGLATALVALGFVLSLMLFQAVQTAADHRVLSSAIQWMQVPSVGGMPALDLSFRLLVDPLSSLMLLIITGVGTLIHLYSMGYMSHDKGYARYFTYLNLFVFFMLLLVMGSNFLVMFVGWEGVGLASYLLIGYFYERKAATDAGKKAFIVNRIGDAALLIALFLIFQFFGTFEFFGAGGVLTEEGIAGALGNGYGSYAFIGTTAAVTLVPLLLFLGAAGKSAQIPLYVWLPDAMEGPTPVSALIHAATMVTGGVYLLARTHALFLMSPLTLTIVAVIGVTTAFLAATIALVQNDIKKVLAYSTVSQLGYMFLACGVGAFGVAMFHVTTHAFFKALLFLGAGSVIHAMDGEQDMRRMGGLRAKLPITFAAMLVGTLAISGFPLLAGFWSKDEILLSAFAGPAQNGLGSPWLWLAGFVVSGMTAFYMMRLMMKTFFGTARYDGATANYLHESPATMTLPLIVLAALSVVGGFLNAPAIGTHYFTDFLGETVGERELNAGGLGTTLLIASAALAIAVLGITFALYNRKKAGELSTDAQKQRNLLWRVLDNKWGVDQNYDRIFVRPGKRGAMYLWRTLDVRVFDGIVNGTAGLVRGLGEGIKGWQSGYVRSYALSMLVGVVLVVVASLIGLGVSLR
ncbi:MAG: NADH-quinone oxidoreductase subunit L [Cytophagales bacterium]|nr:NADH-quinone oxidoreductase subunit L [Armatimonadota bacterium]